MIIIITGESFHAKLYAYNNLTYNAERQELWIQYGEQHFNFSAVKIEDIQWNLIRFSALLVHGSGTGEAPEPRTITIMLQR